MTGVIIVPGLGNSGAQHWQTQWQQRLPNAARIVLSQWQQPDLQSWVDATITAANRFDDSYIVAHSFGCLATVVALQELRDRVRGVLLVAPADPDKFKLAEILPHSTLPVLGVVVGSLSDPWLTWRKAQLWAQRWELPIFCAGDAGHINIESVISISNPDTARGPKAGNCSKSCDNRKRSSCRHRYCNMRNRSER